MGYNADMPSCPNCGHEVAAGVAFCSQCGAAQSGAAVAIGAGEFAVDPRGIAFQYAGFWTRVVGRLIDTLIVVIASVAARNLFSLGAFVGLGYFWYFNARGQTLGQATVGIRIINAAGNPPGAARALGRVLASLLSGLAFGLGYIWAAFHGQHRTWHDSIAGTWVVTGSPALQPAVWYQRTGTAAGIVVAAVLLLGLLSTVIGDRSTSAPQAVAPTSEVGSGAAGSGATGAVPPSSSLTSTATPKATPAAKATPPPIPRLGDTVRVGDLDLTVHELNTAFNSRQYNQFNSENVGVRVTATNARGEATRQYSFSPLLALKLVDTNGVAHSPGLGCAGCPNEIGSPDLVRGGTATGWVYFAVPPGVGLVAVLYQPFLSTNQTRIELR
jgi:uncharacterized RDD family membrane protein YckC